MKTASKTFPVMSTATDPTTGQTYTDYYDMFTVGAGYVDIPAALTNYEQLVGSAESPQVLYNSLLGIAFLVPNLTETWWSSPNWFAPIVWGNSVLVPAPAGTSARFGATAVLGAPTLLGTSVPGEPAFLGHQRLVGQQAYRGAPRHKESSRLS